MSFVSNWFAAVNALSGQLDGSSIKYPSEVLAKIDPSAYAELCKEYSVNQTRRLALAETLAGAVEKAMDVAVDGVQRVRTDGFSYAETVVSGAAGVMQDLYVDGRPYASAAAECVAKPVECVERGKWWKKNREKKERARARAAGVVTPPSSSVSESDAVERELKSQLKKSYDKRRVIENELAECRAKAELSVLADPVLQEMAREAARKKAIGQTAVAACRASKSLSDLEAVSPGSSASQAEVRELKRQIEDRDDLSFEYEVALRRVDPDAARAISQRAAARAHAFEVGVDSTRDLLASVEGSKCDRCGYAACPGC